ncbi:eukaryotic translation initiation factor 5a [Fusarium sporotrichioides]|uniref:Eukaryotic translation initiation factor 5A n=1 Tax=Fusarium sporotrichioides TaxID=5514 RepID=A0A395S236_FUSSP|nr:eukaryotic translation initiation factor 5a [Fusarium sporotrichioides]
MSDGEEFCQFVTTVRQTNKQQLSHHADSVSQALASDVKEKGYLVINGRPCKIVELSKGREKVHFIGIDVFTGKKREVTVKHDANVEVPVVDRTDYQFAYLEDGFLHLIKPDGGEKTDVRVPEGEVGSMIEEYEDSGTDAIVTVLTSMEKECAIAVKEAPK